MINHRKQNVSILNFSWIHCKKNINKWFEYQESKVLVKLSGEGAGKCKEILNKQFLCLMIYLY